MGARDPRVDAWIAELPDWEAEICRHVRKLIHEADPEIEETIKRTTQPYFVDHGTVAAFLAAKDHVNLFVYDGGIVPDPEGLITAGHGNETARTIGFYRDTPIRERALVAFIRRLVADNRAGGWRKLKAKD